MKLIKRNIRMIVLAVLLLLASLVGYGAYSLAVYGNRWFSSAANVYARWQKNDVIPGRIYDRNGTLLASSDENGKRYYHDNAQLRSAVVHVVGDSANNVAYGAESFMAQYLYGFSDSYLDRLRQAFGGGKRQGNDLRLSIDAGLSLAIAKAFPADKAGAVVVMNYKTGELLSLQSFPVFDPMRITREVEKNPLKPFWNRATRWLSAPGSTFKVVPLAAALKNIPDAMTKTYECTGAYQVGDTVITDAGMASHGTIKLKKALEVSCNITFAKLALELGDETLRDASKAFGMNDYFLFSDLVVENSAYPATNRVNKEIAWTGAGQSALLLTPLHMTMITAGIANDGVMMEPKLLLQAVSDAGETKASISPRVYKTPLKPHEADVIAEAMRQVVASGTAGRAAISGLKVCGKTGSAQVAGQEETNAWFIGFLDEPDLPYALCVVIEDGGGGGWAAAPLAGKIFNQLKHLRYPAE
ncbi:MAG: penicillin-binding transpeptidase domain-containing protein [Christensenellales bacterium]